MRQKLEQLFKQPTPRPIPGGMGPRLEQPLDEESFGPLSPPLSRALVHPENAVLPLHRRINTVKIQRL